jgi:hypothetical protein
MQVSKLLGLFLLAILLAATYSLTPVSAGEHPWDSDQSDGRDVSDSLSTGDSTDPGDGDGTVVESTSISGDFLGTPVFWWYMLVEDVLVGDQQVVQSAGTNSEITHDTAGKASSTGNVSN